MSNFKNKKMGRLNRNKLNDMFTSIDQFGDSVSLKINGDDYLRTKAGSLFTILVAVVALSYASIKG